MSSNLKDKMYHYQAEPPATAWNRIAAALQDELPVVANTLQNYQQQPPLHAWEKISEKLVATEQPKPSRVFVLNHYSKPAKYAVAAALIASIAVSAVFFTSNHQTNKPVAKTVNRNFLNNAQASAKPILNNSATEAKPSKPFVADKPSEKHVTAKSNKSILKKVVAQKQTAIVLSKKETESTELALVPQEQKAIAADNTDRYMIATLATGDAVRLPKKVYSAFACPMDAPANDTCKEKLASLQKKMSAALATDFTGFLDLLKNLQENSK